MTVQEINRAIIAGTFTNDDLNSIIDAVKYARSRVANQVRFSVRMGQNVEFTNKHGFKVRGTVEKKLLCSSLPRCSTRTSTNCAASCLM